MEIKYEIPRLEISSLTDDRITLKLKLNEIDEKYETSSIKKSSKTMIVLQLCMYRHTYYFSMRFL
jgi:hypothetical protein